MRLALTLAAEFGAGRSKHFRLISKAPASPVGARRRGRERELSDIGAPSGRQRVLVVGLGTMGMSHARAYQAIDGFELVGLCTRNAAARDDLDTEFAGVPRFELLDEALEALKPGRGR